MSSDFMVGPVVAALSAQLEVLCQFSNVSAGSTPDSSTLSASRKVHELRLIFLLGLKRAAG